MPMSIAVYILEFSTLMIIFMQKNTELNHSIKIITFKTNYKFSS